MTDIQNSLPSKYDLIYLDDWRSQGTKLENRIKELEIRVKELESRLEKHIKYGNHTDNDPTMYWIKH
jgi:ATP-dependent DNA ligase